MRRRAARSRAPDPQALPARAPARRRRPGRARGATIRRCARAVAAAAAVEQRAHRQRLEHLLEAALVVRLRMRQHDEVERATPRSRSFATTPAPGGPPSTSTAAPPGAWSSVASPCPTSRKVAVKWRGGAGRRGEREPAPRSPRRAPAQRGQRCARRAPAARRPTAAAPPPPRRSAASAARRADPQLERRRRQRRAPARDRCDIGEAERVQRRSAAPPGASDDLRRRRRSASRATSPARRGQRDEVREQR